MARLSLALLGPLEVRLDGRAVTALAYDKVWALLIYLALEADRPHRRDTLIGLLWPDQPDQAARTSLRQALTQLRQAIGDHTAQPSFLLIARETIQFNRESDHDLDVTAFEALLATCEAHPHRHPDTCTACARRHREATALYRGSFLDEFFLDGAATFEEWALLKREELHHRVLGALTHLTAYHERRGDYEQTHRYARRQLQLDPWREEAHRQMMRAFALTGQRNAALRQYEACRQVLAEGLGVEPEAETSALYAQIKQGNRQAAGPVERPPTNLAEHTRPTTFIGRETELAQIADRLERRDCWLLTLAGPGGVGKTRLALQAAQEQLTSFRDGIYFVSLAGLSSGEQLVPAIVAALKMSLQGSGDQKGQLLAYLRTKDLLLILDNFEHVLDGTDLLSEIVQSSPMVTLLITSRELLNLRVEWVLDIEGLPVPKAAKNHNIEQVSAVQLFLHVARQVQPGFALTTETIPDLIRICQLVDGAPLALELAAASIRMHSCREIARRIEQNLDYLATTMRDVPARHRSVRAVFEHSWCLLSLNEQSLLAALSVFRDGFQADAATHIADGSVTGLTQLISKSLLRRNRVERYDLHELVRQYAQEKLAEAGYAEKVRDRHLQYFLTLAEEAAPRLHDVDQVVWLDQLETEHNNLSAALAWSMATSSKAGLGLRLATALEQYWYIRGYWDEGRKWLTNVLSLTSEPTALRAAALNAGGFLALEQGDMTSAAPLLEEGLAVSQALEITSGIATALYHLTLICVKRAGHLRARALCEKSVSLFQESGDRRGAAWALLRLAGIVGFLGDYQHEVVLCEQSLALFRELGERQGMIDALHFLGRIARWTGNEARATTLYAEVLALSRELGQKHGIADILTSLGYMAQNQADYRGALEWLEEALALYQELGQQSGIAKVLLRLGQLAKAQGNHDLAAAHLKTSLLIQQQQESRIGMACCLAGLAGVFAQQAQPERAAHLCGATAALLTALDTDLEPHDGAEWERDIAAIQAQLSENIFAAAWAVGRELSLEQAIAEALDGEARSYRGAA